jgi:hypothetical protein
VSFQSPMPGIQVINLMLSFISIDNLLNFRLSCFSLLLKLAPGQLDLFFTASQSEKEYSFFELNSIMSGSDFYD